MLIPKRTKYNLAVSVSYKNDLWNLIEWLEYHILVGVDHFYFYNNDDNPYLSTLVLAPYIQEGYVTAFHSARMFPLYGVNRQALAHNHALNISKKQTKWLAMLDMDEFIFPIHENTVPDVLKDYEDCAQLMVNYACYGSSGHKERQELQTRSYNHRAKNKWEWNKLCKSIGQVKKLKGAPHHHHFSSAYGPMLDEDRVKCGWVKGYKGKYIRINHYLTRSYEDYKIKMARGNPIGEKRDWGWFDWANRNEVYDNSMWAKYGEALLEAISRRKKLYHFSKGRLPIV